MVTVNHYFQSILTCMFLFLFTCMNSVYGNTDSTKINPTNPLSQTKYTVNILHYNNHSTKSTYASINCPPKGTIVTSDFYYYNLGGMSSLPDGYLYYICSETFWSQDSYYKSLISEPWVKCKDNPYYKCSIKTSVPPLISYSAHLPPDVHFMDGLTTKTLSFEDIQLRVIDPRSSYPLTTDVVRKSSTLLPTITWAFDSSDTPANMDRFGFGFNLDFEVFGNAILSYKDADNKIVKENATYLCKATKYVSAIDTGKKCVISCSGNWTYQDKNWQVFYKVNKSPSIVCS